MKVQLKENLKDKDFEIQLPNGDTYKVNKLLNLQGNIHRFYMYLYEHNINDYASRPYFKLFQDKLNEIYFLNIEYK